MQDCRSRSGWLSSPISCFHSDHQRPKQNVSIYQRWESRGKQSFLASSGRNHKPTGSDKGLTPPFQHPRVRCQLSLNHRSRHHYRHEHPGCGSPLSEFDYIRGTFYPLVFTNASTISKILVRSKNLLLFGSFEENLILYSAKKTNNIPKF